MISTVMARVGQAMSHSLGQVRPRQGKRRAGTALREAEEQHRTLLDFCPEGVLVEVEGKIVYCNPAIIELSGFPADEILGRSPTEFIAPEDRERAVAVVGKLLAGTPGDTREYRVLKKDGTFMFTEISSRLITYTGKPALLSMIRDVTERKAAGDALSLRTQELEALFNIASVLVQPGEFEEKAARVLEEVARVARADWVTFRQRAEDGQGFRLVAAAGPEILRNPPMPVSTPAEPLSALAALNGEIVVANDYAARPDASPTAVAMGMNSIVVMPVLGAGDCLGVMNVVSKTPNHFGPELLKLLAAIADGLGVLLENAQLGQDLQANVEEMATVDEIARILTSTLDIDLVYERFAAEVKKVMDFDRIGINVVDEEAGVLTAKYLAGEPVSGINLGLVRSLEGSGTQQVITTRRSVIRSDIAADRRYPLDQNRLDAGLRSGITVPLVANGRVGGSLFLSSRRVGAYGPREQRVLERLAAQIAPAVENSELYGQIKSNAEEMAAVDEIARILTSTLDINQFYEHFAAEVKKLVAFDRIGISIIDQSKGTYTMNYTAGLELAGAPAGTILSLDGSLTEHIMQNHKT
ncbi:MAG: GAF domain-containing protein, partial [Chloroflexi bacterium]|nr:GAF domain-containing protein [Chloroflexota bacterium]